MKKLIRLFIAIFCIFFVLQAMPGSFVPVFRSFLKKTAQRVSESTLFPAEKTGGTSREEENSADPDEEIIPLPDPDGGENAAPAADPAPGETGDDEKDSGGEAAAASGAGSDGQEQNDSSGEDGSGEDESDPVSGTDDSGSSADREDLRDDVFYFYYTKISREERLLYDAMLALARSPEAGAGAEESRLLSLNPSSQEFADSYTRAYNALVTDHPELFWISQGRAKFECRYYLLPSFGGQYKVVLSLVDGEGQAEDGGTDTVRSLSQLYGPAEKELEEAADAILDQVDLSQSDAMIALRLHDLLLDSAWYNTGAAPDDYAHTAYGALVKDSSGNPGGALCDGYALAYEYLLQRAGLTCTMVCGYAGASEEDTEKHAWNLVLLDDEWYEVDATWDDLDFTLSPSEDGYDLLLEALSDEDYMRRIRHYMFNRTTEEMRSFTPGEEYEYTSYNGWVSLLQPSVHIRFSAEESEWTRDFVTPLAPQAEGTWYTWETLEGM